MCGIVGYVGRQRAAAIMLEGLKRLEYRGYDSAGLAVLQDAGVTLVKSVGRVANLGKHLTGKKLSGTTGISHTRWATHGGVTDANAHPHLSSDGQIVLVHNGVIENYVAIKKFLLTKGYTFASETDTEVLANLIAYHFAKEPAPAASGASSSDTSRLLTAVRKTLLHVEGTYGIAVISARLARMSSSPPARAPRSSSASANTRTSSPPTSPPSSPAPRTSFTSRTANSSTSRRPASPSARSISPTSPPSSTRSTGPSRTPSSAPTRTSC